ncbi:MAG: DUF4974 domain-containing protein [Cyclobacteriaceae bacterium]
MPEELDRYNHLRYNDPSSEEKGFVDFLYENSDSPAPDVDVDAAWNRFEASLGTRESKSTPWLKIAASVVVLIGISLFVWNVSTPEQINIASLDEKVSVTFPDGSTGILNANSSFSFPERFGKERSVIFEGEAYFDIIKSQKPFVIAVGGVDVKVLGTAFNLVSSADEVELFVERGLVAFEKEGAQTKVAAGLKAVFSKSSGEVVITENASPNILSWSNGQLVFNDTPLSEVFKDLEEFYEVDFKVSNKRINKCKLTVTFDKKSLSEVIETIESILDVKLTRNNNTVKVSGSGC